METRTAKRNRLSLTLMAISFLLASTFLGAEARPEAPVATVAGHLNDAANDPGTAAGAADDHDHGHSSAIGANPLTPPAHTSINVAFLVSNGAVMIDFTGPWEVFQDVDIPGRGERAFRLYTVAATKDPIYASGGMKIIPDYTVANAPTPRIIVIPAQNEASPSVKEWIRKATKNTDVTMSVCTGALVLASTGLLSGKAATTHHGAYGDLAKQFPDIQVKRGVRFVEAGNLATSGGLSSGIDLALHVVERYFGREVARQTAFSMEYQGEGWMYPDSGVTYAQAYVPTDEHLVCPVCGMAIDPATAPKSVYKGKTYYFGSQSHKEQFDENPDKFAATPQK